MIGAALVVMQKRFPMLKAACVLAVAVAASSVPVNADPASGTSKRPADPIPPKAEPISLEQSLARVPMELRHRLGLQLVLDRTHRQLLVLRNGQISRRFPAAVGTEGWETPAGSHKVLEKVREPVWTHPVS